MWGLFAAGATLAFFEGVGFVEQGRFDDGGVDTLGLDIAVGDAAAVGAVAQDDGNGLARPAVAFAGEDFFRVQVINDLTRAPGAEVLAEDDSYDFGFALVHDEWAFALTTTPIPVGRGPGAVPSLLDSAKLAAADLLSVGKTPCGLN